MDANTKDNKRDTNWSPDEKTIFKDLVSKYVEVIDDKRNDTKMIYKKKEAWRHINEQMMSMGYMRDTSRLKQQWNRMKAQTKTKLAAVRKATIATGNHVPIPSLDENDEEILNLISTELVEDTCLIDSNFQLDMTKPQNISYPLKESPVKQEQIEPKQPPYINKLRSLLKPKNKLSVLEEREQQIKKETALAEELQKKQIEKLDNEIMHQNAVNNMQLAYLQELHENQLRHADELHEMKKKLLTKLINNNNSDSFTKALNM